ncbi:hypothetical protein J4205_03935 [Candidatus Pacearchaeota archaeon]|nr:hypothetical protein [uncultured archaeon]MBS3066952.1 hypothetical protein [Candidatus Pacearchaeota archaeon]
MVNITAKLKRVGNSLGIIVPSDVVDNNDLKEGEELFINIHVNEVSSVGQMLAEARRHKLNFKRSTQEILDEIDRDSD